MTEADWFAPTAAVGMLLAGTAMSERDACGRPLLDDSFLLLLNAGPEPVPFVLPGTPRAADGTGYQTVVDTAAADGGPAGRHLPGDPVPLGARALHLLRAVPDRAAPRPDRPRPTAPSWPVLDDRSEKPDEK